MIFILIAILLLSTMYIWLLHKHDRKSFYIFSIIINIILFFLAYLLIGNEGTSGYFVAYIWTALYILFFLFALIFEIINRPLKLGNIATYKIILSIYLLIVGVKFISYINMSTFIPLAFLASFIIYTYFFLVKGRSSFYIMFILSTAIIFPLFLYTLEAVL